MLSKEGQTAFKEDVKVKVESELNIIEKLFDTFEAVQQDRLNFA